MEYKKSKSWSQVIHLTSHTPWGYTICIKELNKEKRLAVRRLHIAAGQIRGLEKMVEEDKYCIDILHQSLAIKEALSSFEDFILKNHLTTHAAKQMSGVGKSKAVKEILDIYKLSKRK